MMKSRRANLFWSPDFGRYRPTGQVLAKFSPWISTTVYNKV